MSLRKMLMPGSPVCGCQRAVFQLYDLYLPALGGVVRILVDWS